MTPADLEAAALAAGASPKLELRPITFRHACDYIREHHRHHGAPVGWLFGVAVWRGIEIVGVIAVGRPVARKLQDGLTCEVTRCCTNGTPHVASKLYAAAWRAARAIGYRRMITYTLETEPGTSLLAAGWKCAGVAGGGSWSVPSRPRTDKHPLCPKKRWEVGNVSL